MRNLDNAIKKVTSHKGKLSKAVVCYTAKQTLNQYEYGLLKPSSELAELIDAKGIMALLEEPLIDRKLDDELTNAGKAWLDSFFFTKSGKPRNTRALEYVHEAAFRIIKQFSHFTFVGFDAGNSIRADYQPIWRVHSKRGESFDYCYRGGMYSGVNSRDALDVYNIQQRPSK